MRAELSDGALLSELAIHYRCAVLEGDAVRVEGERPRTLTAPWPSFARRTVF